MKYFTLVLSFLLVATITSYAQNGVGDAYPAATIFIVDAQTGQEVLATSDTAIMFKDALIDLVTKTIVVQNQFKHAMGHLSYVITQTDPSNGNEYQLQENTKMFGMTAPVYTFIYNVDKNKLYYSNPHSPEGEGTLEPQWITQNNRMNLNRCQQYGWFNNLSAPQEADQQQQQQPQQDENASEQPVDNNDVTATVAPPALPTYEQPECPQDGYLWQPGYWAYSVDSRAYYWVPGVWVAPPAPELFWTPAYWSFNGFAFFYHSGYWGASVGYYGGIDYGYGYGGRGYYGGDWHEGHFRYNTAVVRVNVNVVHNTYVNKTVIVNETRNTSSFNGRGGVIAKPTPQETIAMNQPHVKPTPDQNRNQWAARDNKGQFASPANGNKPMNVAATRAPEKSTVTTNPTTNSTRPTNGGANNNARPGGMANPNMKPATGNNTTNAGNTNARPTTGNNPATNTGNANTNARPATGNNPTTSARPVYGSANSRPAGSGVPSGSGIPRGSGTGTQGSHNSNGMQSYQRGSNSNINNSKPKSQPKTEDKTDKKDKK